MRLHLLKSLQSCICDLAYLFRLEVFPLAAIKSRVKSVYIHHRGHVDESIAHVTTVVEVYWQVQKVIGAKGQFLVNCFFQQYLGVLVRDVLDHERSTVVTKDLLRGHFEMLDLLIVVVPSLNPTENRCGLSLLLCLLSLLSLWFLWLLDKEPFETLLMRVLFRFL